MQIWICDCVDIEHFDVLIQKLWDDLKRLIKCVHENPEDNDNLEDSLLGWGKKQYV